MIAYLIVSSFLIALLTLFFFFAVLVKGVRSDGGRNLAFCLFSFSIFVWSTGHMFWLLSETETRALYWVKVLIFGSIFVPYAYFHFAVNITGRYTLRKFVYVGYGLAICLALLNLRDFIVVGVEPRLDFPYWPIPGAGFPLYLGGFCSMVVIGALILIWRKLRRMKLRICLVLGFLSMRFMMCIRLHLLRVSLGLIRLGIPWKEGRNNYVI